jgi:phosphatidylinositol-3,4,5-trisphosphate 3-phosphatase/dual-specificity protein phosphatase PTEN
MATTAIKKIVSKKKRRFESEGFNLDLSYVTERVIAMGYPASEHVEAMYRNSLEDVRR